MTQPLDDWLTVADVASMKGVSENSVRVAIRTGRLGSIKKGRDYLVRRDVAAGWKVGSRGPKRTERDA